MNASAAPPCWETFQARAEAVGLNVRVVLPRERAERGFPTPSAAGPAATAPRAPDAPGARVTATAGPAALHPSYASAVLLGSGGRLFWETCRGWLAAQDAPPDDPLDGFTESTVEGLLEALRRDDPTVLAAYPFYHPRQLVPFLGLLRNEPLLATAPFGVPVHPEAGPWYAWRAVVLTRLVLPATALPTASPCVDCPAPCVAACPADAVHKEGFRWEACGDFRLGAATCRETCLARRACPVGSAFAYGGEQMAYHYRASLRMLAAAREGEE